MSVQGGGSAAARAVQDGLMLGKIVRSTPVNPAQQTLEELLWSQAQVMRAIEVESTDGVRIGGVILVRDERTFDLLCQFLTKAKAQPTLPGAVRTEEES